MTPRPRTIDCDAGALTPDAATVDTLARLQLAARRLGCQFRLRNVTAELRDLIGFVGLAEVLGVEPRRETEQREERLGVEEEAELDDPSV